jgi:hypothetical protein
MESTDDIMIFVSQMRTLRAWWNKRSSRLLISRTRLFTGKADVLVRPVVDVSCLLFAVKSLFIF